MLYRERQYSLIFKFKYSPGARGRGRGNLLPSSASCCWLLLLAPAWAPGSWLLVVAGGRWAHHSRRVAFSGIAAIKQTKRKPSGHRRARGSLIRRRNAVLREGSFVLQLEVVRHQHGVVEIECLVRNQRLQLGRWDNLHALRVVASSKAREARHTRCEHHADCMPAEGDRRTDGRTDGRTGGAIPELRGTSHNPKEAPKADSPSMIPLRI